MKSTFLEAIRGGTLLLDGAYGTNLQPLGMRGCPELWVLEHPEALSNLYRQYMDAGAQALLAFTFGANPLKLEEYGLAHRTEELNAALVAIAREAAGKNAYIGADIAPTGRFIQPMGDLPFEEAVDCFKRQVRALAAAGVDYLHIETMMDLQEARAALLAAREVCDLPVLVTLTYQPGGRTLTGAHPVSALLTLQGMGAAAVGLNCSTGPEDMLELVRQMRTYAKVPIVAKPNAGLPDKDGNFHMTPAAFATACTALQQAGATLLGGCCGSTPAHIAALKCALAPLPPACAHPGTLLCSASTFHATGNGLTVVGERINPTGKKDLAADLQAGGMEVALGFARQQQQAGAHVLDVNVAAPGVDEVALLPQAVCAIAARCPLPLSIDTAQPQAADAALRIYPGRALLNSIPIGKPGYEARLAIAHKYGAVALLLPLGDTLPQTAAERIRMIDDAVKVALALGMDKSDLAVDGLTLTVSTDPMAPKETLAVLHYCRSIGIATILGVSNVSFGLPARPALNAAFLHMAAYAGLSMAILNPNAPAMASAVATADLLLGKDPAAARYIAHTTPPDESAAPAAHLPPLQRAVLEGDVVGILPLVRQALAQQPPMDILQADILPALSLVGDGFEAGRLFLPQLMQAADAVQSAFGLLLPALQAAGDHTARGKVVMATVQGDIHDIGKNIVCTLLKSYGYQVTDLGKDVPAAAILDTATEMDADVIGLSALLSTTLPAMREVIEGVHRRGMRCKVMVGGAAVTPEYADTIGADGYSADAHSAVQLCDKLCGL